MPRTPPDDCLVLTEPLAAMVRAFLDGWNRERPQTAGRFAAGGTVEDLSPVRATEWLSRVAGVPEAAIHIVVDRRYRMTELRVADALVTALERPEVFYDGTLDVFPNPSALRDPARRRRLGLPARPECCGTLAAA